MFRVNQAGNLKLEKKKRITPDSLKGFLFAFLFHAGIFFIFKITFLSPPDESHLLPFSEVTAEWDETLSIVQIMPFKIETTFEELEPKLQLGGEDSIEFRPSFQKHSYFELFILEKSIPYVFLNKMQIEFNDLK